MVNFNPHLLEIGVCRVASVVGMITNGVAVWGLGRTERSALAVAWKMSQLPEKCRTWRQPAKQSANQPSLAQPSHYTTPHHTSITHSLSNILHFTLLYSILLLLRLCSTQPYSLYPLAHSLIVLILCGKCDILSFKSHQNMVLLTITHA